MITNELYDITHAGNLEGVSKWLDEKPEDLNADISDGYSALHVACMFGWEPIVHHLVKRGSLINQNARNASQTTPLHLATMFRVEATAKNLILFLLDSGAELNAKQAGGQTPLHHAVARGSIPLVQTLILEGADPFMRDEQGKSPNDLASANKDEEMRLALKRAFSLPLEART